MASISDDYVAKRPPIMFGSTGECVIADPDPCREASPQEPLPEDTLVYDVNENTNKNNQCYLKEVKNRAFISFDFIIYLETEHWIKIHKITESSANHTV